MARSQEKKQSIETVSKKIHLFLLDRDTTSFILNVLNMFKELKDYV